MSSNPSWTDAQVPVDPVAVPPPLREVVARWGAPADAAELPAAWVNAAGGTTFRLEDRGVFCKWAPAGVGLDLAAEADRSRWALRWLAVPEVLEHGTCPEGEWLVTRGLPGRSAVAEDWRARPEAAVPALARGLRRLHDTLPVAQCPFDWSVPHRLARAVGAVEGLLEPPPVDRLVVCHGDACAPNTLLAEGSGEAVAHVDLGALGVADRWADLAVATLSLGWNYGPGWEGTYLAAYGVDPDPVRTAYYRALWEVGP